MVQLEAGHGLVPVLARLLLATTACRDAEKGLLENQTMTAIDALSQDSPYRRGIVKFLDQVGYVLLQISWWAGKVGEALPPRWRMMRLSMGRSSGMIELKTVHRWPYIS